MYKPRFIIKTTYTSGPHAGESHFLRKGGYVTDADAPQFQDHTYMSYGMAKRACRQMFEKNEQEVEIERKNNEFNISRGKKGKDWFIYEHQTYEPYEVPEDRYWDM